MIRADLAGWALLLIAIAIAYFICLKASKEGSKIFKIGGYAIGVIILVISLILAISDIARRRPRRMRPRRTRTSTTAPQIPPEIQKMIQERQQQQQPATK